VWIKSVKIEEIESSLYFMVRAFDSSLNPFQSLVKMNISTGQILERTSFNELEEATILTLSISTNFILMGGYENSFGYMCLSFASKTKMELVS